MRIQFITALLLAFAASAWAQPKKGTAKDDACACTPEIQERLRGRLAKAKLLSTLSVPTNVVHCDSTNKSGCENEAVVVFDQQAQTCLAALQYCVLCVAPDDSFQPELKWTLVDKNHKPSTQFVFTKKGIDIPGSMGGTKHFKNPHKHPSDGTLYFWTAVKHQRSGQLRHTTNIQPSGKGEARCDPFDPVIVNNAN